MIRFLQSSSMAKKVLLGLIIGLVALTMVITLIPGGFLGADEFGQTVGVVAHVDGDDITTDEVQRTAQSLAQRQFGGRAAPPQFMPFFMQRAADMLINERVLAAEASRLGLRITDTEFVDELRRNFGEQLFPGGQKATREQYQNFVAGMSQQIGLPMSIPQFEALYRQQLLINKLRSVIADPVTVPEEHIRKEYEYRNTEVKLEYAVVSTDELMKQIKVTDAELKAYFDANQATRYLNAIPEKRKLRYIVLDPAQLQEKVEVTRQDLQRFYDDRQNQFREPEQVKVRHILVRTPDPGPDGKPDEKAVEAARAKAEDLLKQVRAGADFAELAKKSSDDPGSAPEGGDLGWIQRGQTVPEFEKTSFELEKGKVSDVVKTSYGFHVIKVEDKQPARLKPLDEVADQLRTAVRQEKAQSEIEAQVNAVHTRARSAGLDKAAAESGLQVVSTGMVERTSSLPGLGVSPQFMEAAFSAKPKDAAELARLRDNFAVFEVLEVEPARTPSFEEFRARVENDFKSERAGQMAPQRLSELSDRARALNSLRAAARELGLTVKSTDFVRADGQVPDVGAPPGAAFRMQPKAISDPVSQGRSGYVFSVLERKEASMEQFAAERGRIREQLLEQKRNQVFETFAANAREQLQKEGKVRINDAELKRLTNFGRG
jgi:peptidyl-prolyl cis-trans isomerase D